MNPVALMKEVVRPYWRQGKHAMLPRVLRVPQIRVPCEMIGGRENDPDHFGRLTLNPRLLTRDSVVYAFGIGDDITFDLGLIARFGCHVHAFDPAPDSIAWAKKQQTPPKWILHEFGLCDIDGVITLYPPDNPEWVANTVFSRQYSTSTGTACPVHRLETIMGMLGHDHIDLLKMNIEGGEYAAIEDLLKTRLPVRQLLVSFHHHFKEIGVVKTLDAIRALNAIGYYTFSTSFNGQEVAFLNTKLASGAATLPS